MDPNNLMQPVALQPTYDYGKKSMNRLIIPLAVAVLLLIGTLIFGMWAYQGRNEYKANVDQKVTNAVASAKQQEANAKETEFAERIKQPLKTYAGPQAYGSVTINYPKTWSSYVIDDGTSSPFIDGYFFPGTVPDIQSQSVAFALRVQVVSQSYASVMQQLQTYVSSGKTTVTPYKAPKVSNVIGSKVVGQISDQRSGTMVLFQVRDKTLEIWTEAPQYQSDFDTYILPNFTFLP